MGTIERFTVGQPFRPKAAVFNRYSAATEAVEAAQAYRGGGPLSTPARANLVKLRNDTGGDLARFDVAGIGEPVFDADANLHEFQTNLCLKGETPDEVDHLGLFAVAVEPIPAGRIGLAALDGLVAAKVTMDSGEDWLRFADIDHGQTGHLKARPIGAAQIISRQAGTGAQWAVVRLGPPPPGIWYFAQLDAALSAGGSASATFYESTANTPGTPATGSVSETVYDFLMQAGDSLASGLKIGILYHWQYRRWHVFAAECD